jgi:hypothetical protein
MSTVSKFFAATRAWNDSNFKSYSERGVYEGDRQYCYKTPHIHIHENAECHSSRKSRRSPIYTRPKANLYEEILILRIRVVDGMVV